MFTFSLVGTNDSTELSTDLELVIPVARSISVTSRLDSVASRALLFTGTVAVFTAEVVGGTSSRVGARASISTASVDRIPHTFRVEVALSLVRVAVDALESALGVVAGGEPVTRRIAFTISLGEVVLTELTAEVSLGVPSAHNLSGTRASVRVVGASLLTDRFGSIPHAGSIRITSRFLLVLVRTLAVARAVVGVEGTHDLFLLTFGGLELVTSLLTLTNNSIEHASSLSATALVSKASGFALSGTSRSVGVEFTSGVRLAGSLSRVTTLAHALSGSSRVDTLSISITGSFSDVAVSTLRTTFLGGGVILAHTVASTVTVVVSDRALAATLVTESIPLATTVGVTGRLSGVRRNTLGNTSESRRVFTERRSIASHGSIGGTSFEGNTSTRSLAEFSSLVPHTVLIRVATVEGTVFNDASLDALLTSV